MKKLLYSLPLVTLLSLSSCFLLSDETKAKQSVKDKTFSETTDGYYYVGQETYTITFYNDTYDSYYEHVNQHREGGIAVEDEKVSYEGETYKYLSSSKISWVGDWGARHSVTYHVFELSKHPRFGDTGYFIIENKSTVGYIDRSEPRTDKTNDFTDGERVILQKGE